MKDALDIEKVVPYSEITEEVLVKDTLIRWIEPKDFGRRVYDSETKILYSEE